MSRLRSALQRSLKDNSGSAVISVVIATLFVVALGTALLFAAYMGIQVSVSSRNEKENFYDAAAALDEIKAGIQDEVSTSLGSAYTTILVKYGQGAYGSEPDPDAAAQAALESTFLSRLCPATADSTHSFSVNGIGSYQLSLDTLKTRYITNPTGLELSGGAVSYDAENSTLTVKSLTAQHIADGYESDVTTDIVISVPDFFTGASVAAKLGEYTIVAYTGIVADYVSGGELDNALESTINYNYDNVTTIRGGVFAGMDGIRTGTVNDKLKITGGNVVTSGEISTSGKNSGLKIDASGYDVWATGFNATKLSDLIVSGSCYVADDLEINGGADVTLSGSYFGFGKDTTKPDASSSIFVNSYALRTVDGTEYKTRLNLSKLYNLTLSGISFIHTAGKASTSVSKNDSAVADNNPVGSDLLTGQSMAIKTDQLAYLVPAAAVKNYKTNPAIASYDEDGNLTVPAYNTKTFLWEVNGVSRNLAYYLGIPATVKDKDGNSVDSSFVSSGSYGSIVSYYTQSGTESTVYFFLSFTNQDKANEYFRDYFAARPDSITQYLDVYMALESNPNLNIISKGTAYDRQSGRWSLISGSGADYNSTLADHYGGMFDEMTGLNKIRNGMTRQALINEQFKSYVETMPTATRTFKQGNKTVAVISVGASNYIYSGDPNIKLIVADGDVTINDAFSGIIICKGTVHVKANITAAEISSIKGAVDSDGKTIESYLAAGLLGGSTATEENKWSPDNLVYYENWQKS